MKSVAIIAGGILVLAAVVFLVLPQKEDPYGRESVPPSQ